MVVEEVAAALDAVVDLEEVVVALDAVVDLEVVVALEVVLDDGLQPPV